MRHRKSSRKGPALTEEDELTSPPNLPKKSSPPKVLKTERNAAQQASDESGTPRDLEAVELPHSEPVQTKKAPNVLDPPSYLRRVLEKKNGDTGSSVVVSSPKTTKRSSDSETPNAKVPKLSDTRHSNKSPERSGTSSATPTPSRKRECSSGARWNLIEFGTVHLVDGDGIPLDRNLAQENLKKLRKTDKDADFSPFIDLALEAKDSGDPLTAKLSLGVSTLVEMVTNLKRQLREIQEKIAKMESFDDLIEFRNGFDIDAAKEGEETLIFPTGRSFKMSDFMDEYDCDIRSTTDYERHGNAIIRNCLKQVVKKEPYFIGFSSAPDSTNIFVPVSKRFYRSISSFLMRGFGQRESSSLQTKTAGMAKGVVSNLLDRERIRLKALGTKGVDVATELRERLEAMNFDPPIVPIEKD